MWVVVEVWVVGGTSGSEAASQGGVPLFIIYCVRDLRGVDII